MIVVTTPTGRIGSRVVDRLLESGTELAVLARDPTRLPVRVRERATVHTGDLQDADFVRDATAGASALFFLIPPGYDASDWRALYLRIAHAGAEAVRANRIPHVVFLSSVGAHRTDLGPISWLGEVEGMLRQSTANLVSLRAGSFMENFLAALPTLAAERTMYQPFSPGTRTAMVATRDIGDVAAGLLLDRSWSGHSVQGVHGPADLTFGEAAAEIGRALGMDIRYVQITPAQMREGLLAAGMSAAVASEYAQTFKRLEEIGFERAEPRTPATTTPTTLATWAAEDLRRALIGTAERSPSLTAP